jgi:hypothetical protein
VIRRRLVLVPLLVLAGCSSSPSGPSTEAKARLGDHVVTVLEKADRVEVFRLDADSVEREIRTHEHLPGERILGRLVIARGPNQGKPFAGRLAAVLFDKATYSKEYVKCFYPGVAFRLWAGEEWVQLTICFRCNNVGVDTSWKEERFNFSFLHTPARARLLELAKEAFPDDKDIQDFKE